MSWPLQDTKHGVSFRESSPKMIYKVFSSTAPLKFHLRSVPFLTGIWKISTLLRADVSFN